MGEKPEPCWRRNGSRNVAVNSPANATTTLARPAVNGRIRNSARSIMGWIEPRSTTMKAPPRTTNAISRPMIAGLLQPHC